MDQTLRKQKLLDQARDVLRQRGHSIHTESSYVDWMRRFILFHGKRHPREMAAPEIETFLTHLAVDRRVAASTQQQALSALLFLYHEVLEQDPGPVAALRPRHPHHLPGAALTHAEVQQVIATLSGVSRLVVQLLYGAGLRLIECLRLRVGELDFDFHQITVRDRRGTADHVTMLPQSLVSPLREHLRSVAELHRCDLAAGYGALYLPPAIEEEHLDAHREWRWQYVFPASRLSTDPRSGLTRRHRLDESVPQKAVHAAALAVGIDKRINCRAFRDAFAAHLLETGYDVRTVQELLGHKEVHTTLNRYTHILKRRGSPIRSPLDK